MDDQCLAGTCTGTLDRNCGEGCLVPADCDDGDPCTIDSCADGVCTYEAITGGDCACGSDIDCNDANGCTLDSCSLPVRASVEVGSACR